jgi:hypothetical protein
MAETTYTFSISEDFPNGKLNGSRLRSEIQASAIITALERVDSLGDEARIVFKAELSEDDQTALNGLVAAHTGEPLSDDVIPVVQLNSPQVEGNTPVVASNTWPLEHNVVWCGEGDDVAAGSIGGGVEFAIEQDSQGDGTVELQFIDPIRLGGGHVFWKDCAFGDWASFLVYAPATSNIVSNPGAGAYAKLPIGGGASVLVTPGVPGSDGPNWDVNLSEPLNANVNFPKAVPVPAAAGDGFFTYDVATRVLTYTPGTGTHNLFDAEIPLSMFIRKLRLMDAGDMDLTVFDNVPACILPQWKSRVTLHRDNADGSARKLVWSILLSRLNTV